MRVVVLTSCTGAKAVGHARALGPADFRRGTAHVASRERECADALTPAEGLYAGAQHRRLMRGVRAFRACGPAAGAIDLWILSAGYGLVPHDRRLAPYECTFLGMGAGELRAWADALGVPAAVRDLLAAPYDLGLVLLGEDYLRACALDADVRLGGPTLFFCGAHAASRLPRLDRGRVIVLARAEARRFACGLVGLKGEVAARLLARLADAPQLAGRLLDPDEDVLTLLDEAPASALTQGCDTAPGGRGDWANEVYTHRPYSEQPYDGVLVSRAVIKRGRKAEASRRECFERPGVHRYLRMRSRSKLPIATSRMSCGYCRNHDGGSRNTVPLWRSRMLASCLLNWRRAFPNSAGLV